MFKAVVKFYGFLGCFTAVIGMVNGLSKSRMIFSEAGAWAWARLPNARAALRYQSLTKRIMNGAA